MATDHTDDKFTEIFKRAIDVFKDIDQALSWINEPCTDLNGNIPIHVLGKPDGVEIVSDALERINYSLDKR